jgi:predicted nucleotidyltransferase
MVECAVSAEVADDEESLLTPCRYLLGHVEVLAGDPACAPREVMSFRGRFAEQAKKGERVFARGRLERVRSEELEYYRLVVGEDPRDVLRTIW